MAPKETTQEFIFTDADFSSVCKMIYAKAGISLNNSKKPMVYTRLARRLRELGIGSFAAYLQFLQNSPTSEEWTAFTNALTTNLTAFFREGHHFDVLADLLPKWHAQHGSIRIWSTAASTGEEPYSIAMTLHEALGQDAMSARILASDLDTKVLETASQGVYPLDRLERLSVERKRRFFLKGNGAQSGLARVRPELKHGMHFKQINLLDAAWPVKGPLDAIFCRNVMIYFDKPTQRRLLERFVPLLHPDGRLFVGHSESLNHVSDLWAPCGRTVYRLNRGR